MNKTFSWVLAALVLAGAAQAATVTQSFTIDEHGPGSLLTPYTENLTFVKFNDLVAPSAGVLNSVTIILSVSTWGGSVANDNDGLTTASGDVAVGMVGALTSSDVTLLNGRYGTPWASLRANTTGHFDLGVNAGDTASQFDVGGDDYAVLAGPTDEDSAIDVDANDSVHSVFVDQYDGTGSFVLTFQSVQNLSLLTGGAIWGQTGPMLATGEVTVIYDYTPIPEPATMALVGIGGLVIGLRRRFAKKA